MIDIYKNNFPSTPFLIALIEIQYNKQVKMLAKNAKEPLLPTFKRHFDSNSDFSHFLDNFEKHQLSSRILTWLLTRVAINKQNVQGT